MVVLFSLVLALLPACGRGGTIEGAGSTSPAPETDLPVVENKQYLGGAQVSGSGGGQTYRATIGLSHIENNTLSGGGYKIIMGNPQQVGNP